MKIKDTVLAFLCVVILLCAPGVSAQRRQPTDPARNTRLLLIPLDDRPPCVQFPIMIGRTGDAEVVTPPREMLGRFTVPGDTEKIAEWVRAQDLRSFDAVIVAVDMVAYGGLVNSRVHRTPLNEALARLDLLRWIRRTAPRLPVYGFNVIMRLAPTGDGRNEAYREKLARWAEISPDAAKDATLAAEVPRLEKEIPAAALSDYKAARERNFTVNRSSIEMVKSGVLDYLILSQDDAKPRGVHVADRERLIAEANRLTLQDRVAVQPGADEVAMLLLARALNKKFNYSPRIAAIFSSEEIRNRVAPFEDRPLHRTVSFHIASTGSREVTGDENADLLFYVYASRKEAGNAVKFAERIARDVDSGRRVIVADVDPIGDVQGADPVFTEELRKRKVFERLVGYASWNTAGNTIGTALPHGLVYSLSLALLSRSSVRPAPAAIERVGRAQIEFLLHRLIDDYAYHSLIRPEARKLAASNNLNPNGLQGEGEERIENFIRERLRPEVDRLWRDFANRPFSIGPKQQSVATLLPTALNNFRLDLPWGRTFEAEITFDVVAVLAAK